MRSVFSASPTRLFRRSGRASLLPSQWIADILEHGQTRPKPKVLEHHADAAITGQDRLHHPVSKIDLAVIECFETSQEPCQCRLARPGRTEYVRHLSRPELQRRAVNSGDYTMSLDQSIKNNARSLSVVASC